MPKKILVIEDEESIRNIIRVFLEDAGYTVFVAVAPHRLNDTGA